MKLSQATILLVACTSSTLSFAFGDGKDMRRRNVEHVVEGYGTSAIPVPKTTSPASTMSSIQSGTRWNISQVLSPTTSSPLTILSGKGPETGFSTSEDCTESLPTVSMSTTARGPETPRSSSTIATSTALGVFTSIISLSTITVSPRITGVPSLSLVSNTVGGTTGVVVTIISQAPSQTDTTSSVVSTSAAANTTSSSDSGIVTIISSPDEATAIFFSDETTTILVTNSPVISTPQLATITSTDSIVITAEPMSSNSSSATDTGGGFVTILVSATSSSNANTIVATAESEVQQTNTVSTLTVTGLESSESPLASPASTLETFSTSLVASFPPMTSTSTVYTSSNAIATFSSSSNVALSSAPAGTTVSMPSPTIVQSSGQYTYIGCFSEGVGQRALQNATFPNDSNTIALCAEACYPFKYAGAEYGRECWCGDSLEGGASQVPDSQCAMPCAGDATEVCGDSVKLSLYEWVGNSIVTQTSSSQAVSSTTAAVFSQLPLSTSSASSTTTELVSTTVSSPQSYSVFITEPPSTTSPSSSPPLTPESQNPSVSIETTTQFMNGNSITLSFTLPTQAPTNAYSLVTSYFSCSASIQTVFAAASPVTFPTPSQCNCPAQVTLTVTDFQTISYSANETGTYYAPPPPASTLSGTSTITGNWILESPISWTETSIETTSWPDTTMNVLEGSSMIVETSSAGIKTVGMPVVVVSSTLVQPSATMSTTLQASALGGSSTAVTSTSMSTSMSTSNTVRRTTENASPTSSSATSTPTQYDGPKGEGGRSETGLKLTVLLGAITFALLI